MEPCCERMGELLAYDGVAGLAARLPLTADVVPGREEQPPALVWRSISREREHELDGVNKAAFPLMLEITTFINFCPFCGRDWRVPSVSEALSVHTLSEAENEARRQKAFPLPPNLSVRRQ